MGSIKYLLLPSVATTKSQPQLLASWPNRDRVIDPENAQERKLISDAIALDPTAHKSPKKQKPSFLSNPVFDSAMNDYSAFQKSPFPFCLKIVRIGELNQEGDRDRESIYSYLQ